ncbi:MAG: S-layer homology domain-containing protein [Candidatus Bipolaricaulota bacterium]
MKRTWTILAAAGVLAALFGLIAAGQTGNGTAEPVDTGGMFTDVAKTHWAYSDLEFLASRGIITGLPGGRFNGDQPMDRYTVAVYIARAVRYLESNPESVATADLDALKTLIFGVSDSVTVLQSRVAQLQGGGTTSNLEARVALTEQGIAQLRAQVDGMQGTTDVAALAKRVQSTFILSITALLVGIGALALATIGL